jgi:hypothetical protein
MVIRDALIVARSSISASIARMLEMCCGLQSPQHCICVGEGGSITLSPERVSDILEAHQEEQQPAFSTASFLNLTDPRSFLPGTIAFAAYLGVQAKF